MDTSKPVEKTIAVMEYMSISEGVEYDLAGNRNGVKKELMQLTR